MMTTSSQAVHRSRGGFTLVELLAVIAIIGVLVGLLLPAVQAARESARRSTCGNNIRQLALACLTFADARKALPAATDWAASHPNYATDPSTLSNARSWSYIAKVLPFMEQTSRYNAAFTSFKNAASGGTAGDWSNAPATGYRLPEVECPSDRMIAVRMKEFSPTSYRASGADGFYSASTWSGDCAGTNLSRLCARTPNRIGSLGKIIDGLSKTIMLGEAIIGDGSADRRTNFVVANSSYNSSQKPSLCVAASTSPGAVTRGSQYPGGQWATNAIGMTWFHTVQQPNSPRCSYTDLTNYGAQYVVSPLSSFHNGGAQVAMCDGAVLFLTDTIDNNNLPDYSGSTYPTATEPSKYGVLGALGTAAQGETVTLE